MAQYSFATLQPEYQKLWLAMEVIKKNAAMQQAQRIAAPQNKQRYKSVEARTGIPWFVIGCLHMRESDGNFNTWLHNGDPMRRQGMSCQTVNVPRGRPPNPNCTWEDGAVDALQIDQLDQIKDWKPEYVAYAAEKYNGWGYRNPTRDIPSPYLWGGTNIQKPGKFIRDGVYDRDVVDPQLGCMAVLKTVMQLDADAKFASVKIIPTAPISVPSVPQSPKADDTESNIKPLPKSKTLWGGGLQWIATAVTSAVAFFQGMPPWLIAVIVVASLIGLYLVVKGRIDIQNVVKHLSQDDTGEQK